MNDGFVPFWLAVKLKEKGFPQDGFIGYDEFRTRCIGDEHSITCASPTISPVLKWLREEKLILIGLYPIREYDVEKTIEWCAAVYKADKQGGFSFEDELYYESYEQAALAGIEYCLDNLI